MSVDNESISSILGKSTPDTGAVEKTEAAPPAVETSEPDKPRDESGKFKAAEPADKPAEQKPAEKPRADVAAIIDERRKRQALEQKLAQYEKTPKATPSVFDDEEGAINTRVQEATAPLREAFYKLSVKAAKASYGEDWTSAETSFLEHADRDPRLIEGLRGSDDPGEYIYSMGVHLRELADVNGNLGQYRQKITGEMQTKLSLSEAQVKALTEEVAALKKAQADLESIPRSLNTNSSGAAPKAGTEDPEDINSIVRFGKPNTR